MNKKSICLSFMVLLAYSHLQAQDYPQNYFSSPLDTPLTLVGTFGEIRDDHFHSGIDLGTQELEGVPVMSAADGYISRIKIAPDGFGKALYITHPNGYVTVYGHLQKFTQVVNEYVRKAQYEQQKFAIELFPKPKEFRVKKAEVIAYSGSSGSATGPHLHFEIRHEETEEPINPLLFGIPVHDNVPPEIKYIRFFPTPEAGIVDKTDTAETFEIQVVDGVNIVNTPDFIQAFGMVSIGFAAVDHQEYSTANLGIYSAELFIDQNPVYQWRMDRFNFDDTRYVNAHIDYLSKKRDNITIERFFRLPGNHLPIYGDSTQLGYQNWTEDAPHDIRIVVKDFNGNTSLIEFQVISYSSMFDRPYQPRIPGAVLVTNQKGIAIHKNDLDVIIPSGAVYEDFYFFDSQRKSNNYLSQLYTIGDPYVAIQTPVTIGIKPSATIADSLKSKAVIVHIREDGSPNALLSAWNGAFLSAKSRSFGDFAVLLDTIPPQLVKEYVPADLNSSRGAVIQVKVSDDLSGLKSYSGTLDEKWILFEYDAKNRLLQADLSAVDTNHEHTARINVMDNCGNTTVWEYKFWF
ncbi:MAG: M23 family metallopeptidase [Bacteroidetes bacterium]|nr:M23 family metallopeptidase [Bacteroidota bacterium]MBK9542238.1 M23 family metallopeptidase [Bacteroidota bacterium]MBP6403587.1 M23 family metallopeptidase [Bacteroidia bacterium]MBP6649950.1 M23 family metallopeptidase [Bacteroidia bacterium]